ncbi:MULTISPECIES: ABC transporter substrate-binding protein [Pseudanabaena]|uniref:ABC-type transporter, periplasmic subunit n=2 Tax=Pseudanabaena TaxID=1152 RepID=L8N570_9CYAN|nr:MULTISPECIES: ABC transporter substrate-binding protein [Pseudanabaena]ELS34786.1 ABC-type transporter, periplasmic subunit [Pseudanabaena biceps PCC 7429]MDG3493023.1 ABC transporter substrate-binding protein [Pseudanabaena catenata USMAC16]
MKTIKKLCLVFVLIGATVSSCTVTPVAKQREGCVDKYEPDRDYFPVKSKVDHAIGFSISYHKNYKVVTVNQPWKSAKEEFRYALVQCGTPNPAGFTESQIVQVPVRTVAILSTTHLAHLEKLDLLDRIVAMDSLELVYGEDVKARLKRNNVQDAGRNNALNLERLLALSPDLITTYGTGNPARDSHPKLLEAGLKVAINAEYMESSPLGQAEWIKFTALFFNQEDKANLVFADIVTRYEKVAAIAKTAKQRPTVLIGFHRSGTWYMAGGKSYAAKFLEDAGASYLWADEPTAGSNPLSFEAVYLRGRSADFWLNGSQDWKQKEDIPKSDGRYRDFQAWQIGQMYNNNARISNNGGNDYWQSGITNPDVVLADLVKIFHPELMPDYQLFYYKKLAP